MTGETVDDGTGGTRFDGVCALPHWGVIRAEGADAATFLHGQLTQDVLGLDAGHARLAAYCSPKGRMLASFVMWRPSPETVLLACHRSVLAATLKRLSMFVMRAKCTLSDATDAFPLTGLAGLAAAKAIAGAEVWSVAVPGGAHCIRLPDAAGSPRAWHIGGAPAPVDARPVPALPLATWRWLEVQSGIATIEAATADRFVPQMLNYEQIGGVNFQKGCYPGQEVVARSQYRSTAKRRAQLFETAGAAQAGDELFHSDDPSQPAGMVVDAASRIGSADHTIDLLAEVKLQALEHGSLHVASPSGPVLHQRPLPYDIAAATP